MSTTAKVQGTCCNPVFVGVGFRDRTCGKAAKVERDGKAVLRSPRSGSSEGQMGRTRAKVTEVRTLDAIHGEIHANVEVGSQVYTDDHMVFHGLDGLFYRHDSVNHRAGEYARGPVSTNSIESVWAVLKRGLHGVYHHASAKHLDRYVQEFAWRLNEGNVKRHSLDRLASFVDAIVGKRLTYQRLISEVR